MTAWTTDKVKNARIAAFLQIAEEELEGARRLADVLPKQASFFLQQTVEKLARAVLEFETIPAGITHSIDALANLLPEGHILKQKLMAFEDLSSAATRYRYPTERGTLRTLNTSQVKAKLEAVELLHAETVNFLKTPKA
jgi:HEPN domain-containing protein